MSRPPRAEAGLALLHVLLSLTMVTVVAGGAAMLARIDLLVSRFHHTERDAMYAAQAMVAAALQDLDGVEDWSSVLAGSRHAAFADGAVAAPRQIPGAGTVVVCCAPGSLTARAQAESGQPWQPFGWQSLSGLLDEPRAPRHYVVAWTADDPGDEDGDAAADSNDRLILRAESVTPLGVRRAVEVLVERAPLDGAGGTRPPGVEILTWREVR